MAGKLKGRKAWAAVLVALVLTAVGLGSVGLARHHSEASALDSRCPLREATGWHCAGCGATRAATALVHLDLGAAIGKNALFVVALPFLAVLLVMEGGARVLGEGYRGPRVRLLASCAWWLPSIVLAFWVLRNVPAWPFTLLAP